jgi:signal transduction histidine kinase
MRRSRDELRNLAAKLQAAREEERAHIARELHDEVGQTLTSLKLELLRTVKVLQRSKIPRPALDRVQSLIGLTEISIETTRRLATDLRPAALDHLGLAEAIRWEASAVQSRTGVRCRVVASSRPSKLSETMAIGAFRIFQEALTNVARHAHASAVRIVLRETDQTFTMTVKDNGRGITAREAADPTAIGLVGMRERARLLGGTVDISSRAGKGTTVLLRMPVPGSRR